MADEEIKEGIDFGEYAIVDGITHQLEKKPDWFWKFKPVNSGLELERSKFMLHNRIIETADGIRRELPPTWLEVAHRELALTFGGTNITDRKGEPVLPEKPTVQQIERFLAGCPQGVVMELWNEVAKLYPTWGPANNDSPNAG